MCCVIKAVIFLAKKGLPYRGTSNMEAAYNLADIGDHGNFLDVIKLIACFDKDLASHLDNITKKAISKKGKIARQSVKTKTKRARGSRSTFLSKATIETVYTVIAKMVKDTILNEVELNRSWWKISDFVRFHSRYQCHRSSMHWNPLCFK